MNLDYSINSFRLFLTYRMNYLMGNYRKPIWVVGDGRSGTTWLSELINWQGKYRELFEPYHPLTFETTKPFRFHHYLRKDDTEDAIIPKLKSVYSGKYIHQRSEDRSLSLFHKGIVIKDIFSHLYVAWIKNYFPDIKIIFIIRNPFSVALSKYRLKNWIWMDDLSGFLHQEYLMKDYLNPFEDFIRNMGNNFIEKQLTIWSIIHFVPFKQLSPKDVHIVFYENLLSNPKEELQKLFKYIHGENFSGLDPKLLERVSKPSRLSFRPRDLSEEPFKINSWKDKLSSDDIDKGIYVLNHFGLEKIYDEDFLPRYNDVLRLMNS